MQKLLSLSLSPVPLWVAGAMLLSSCGAPLGPIPGGKLQGITEPWPKDWSHAEDVDNVLLETNPSDPYSVTFRLVLRVHFRRGIKTLKPMGEKI